MRRSTGATAYVFDFRLALIRSGLGDPNLVVLGGVQILHPSVAMTSEPAREVVKRNRPLNLGARPNGSC
jgi:hypothetical protein